jgi:HK97 family phage major capsid protein
MSTTASLKIERQQYLDKSESIIRAAEAGKRKFTSAENKSLAEYAAGMDALNARIGLAERSAVGDVSVSSLSGMFGSRLGGMLATDKNKRLIQAPKRLSAEYAEGFLAYVRSVGRDVSAALYESSNPAGGYAVPIVTDGHIIPLATEDTAIRRVATVIPTTADRRYGKQATLGTAVAKTESGSSANSFAGTEPTLAGFMLSAFMAGTANNVSQELVQDVPTFLEELYGTMVPAQNMYEEGLFLSGTGTGEAQGLLGNVGNAGGTTAEPDGLGNLININSTFDLMGLLKTVYLSNASFLMNRATAILIRKAQVQTNLYQPVFTREGGQDRFHGFPVEYSASMPLAARGASPLLFGDFRAGYLIGDRGGSALSLKVIDQDAALAMEGLVRMLTFRRTDGRVRRSEAIQQYNIAAS